MLETILWLYIIASFPLAYGSIVWGQNKFNKGNPQSWSTPEWFIVIGITLFSPLTLIGIIIINFTSFGKTGLAFKPPNTKIQT